MDWIKMKKMLELNNYYKLLICFFVAAIFLTACEREITIDLPEAPEKLVVDGYIYEGAAPVVVLTRNQAFYGDLSFADTEGLFASGAKIFVTSKGQEYELSEISFPIDSFDVVFYTDFSGAILGERETCYDLRIEYEEKIYTSTTYIPNILPMDSIWSEASVVADRDNLARVKVTFSDPDTLGNYYRYFTKRNSEPVYPGLGSVFDDQVINGESFPAQFDRGYDRNSEIDFTYYGYFDQGDTVTVRLCGIDEAHYTFWQTMEAGANRGGPFAPLTLVDSNIEGENVLGVWGGYSIEERSLIVPFE